MNFNCLGDFVAMETTVVLNNFPKAYICITTFFISVKKLFSSNLFVAMVTKFKILS